MYHRVLISCAAAMLSLLPTRSFGAENVEYLQNWPDREWFYTFSQGSEILPYEWFLALEKNGSQDRFIGDGLARFGYIPNKVSKTTNPDGLPVGFAKSVTDGKNWVGMNCAACHTARIRFGNRLLQIDGGGGFGDLTQLIDGVAAALRSTSSDDEKFKRFAAAVGKLGGTTDENVLRGQLADYVVYFNRFSDDSRPHQVRAQAGRTDAFRLIFNRVFSINLDNLRANTKTPEAPVRYPRLWGTGQFAFVQWTGILSNRGEISKLGRNVGQVLGVFAHMPLLASPAKAEPHRFRSTARMDELLKVEDAIGRLPAPPWPGKPIDRKKADRGKEVFEGRAVSGVDCKGCHRIDRDEKGIVDTPIIALRGSEKQPSLATDSRAATLLACDRSLTGPLEGEPVPFGEPFKSEGPTIDLLSGVVLRALLDYFDPGSEKPPPDAGRLTAAIKAIKLPLYKNPSEGQAKCDDPKSLAYKAAPLTGIWATAPYLHNGSVPTLADLLKPANRRPRAFVVSGGVYDEKNVGIVVTPSENGIDTSLWGNKNTGHEGAAYGTELPDSAKQDLLEYLKSL